MPPKPEMKLGAFLMGDGHHIAAWRHPDVVNGASLSFERFKRLAQLAELAAFDMIFFADHAALGALHGD